MEAVPMKFLQTLLFCFSLLLGASCLCAAPADEIEKAIMRAAVRAAENAQNAPEKKGTLSQAQIDEVPGLVQAAAKRAQEELCRPAIGEKEIMAGLQMYFEVLYGLPGTPEKKDVPRIKKSAQIHDSFYNALVRQRALMSALKTLAPRLVSYDVMDYPQAKDWTEYQDMRQTMMKNVYDVLKKLENCDWEEFQDILCNLM